jgi:peptidoglycan/LPS O-acetylase OafA/YrhL
MISRADLMGTARTPHRWPALDGLRGSAVLAVLVCHYSSLLPQSPAVGTLELGWAGVDLFFVISGFLITGILFDAKGSAHFFRNFYARRTLRIVPLYYGSLAVTLLVMLALRFTSVSPRGGLEQLWAAQPSLWTYTANYWIPAQKTWSPWAEIVIPLWSLSVEEQFYLLWPLVVFRFSRRALIWICVAVFAGALLVRLGITASGATTWFAIYTMTPTRADALAAGALVALLLRSPNDEAHRRTRTLSNRAAVISAVALCFISGGFDPIHHPWLRNFLYTDLAILFAAVLFWSIDAGSLRGIPSRFYSLPVLRTIGGYSYGVYVVHLPLMYLLTATATRWNRYDPIHPTWPASLALIAVNVAVTGGVALLSFHFFEKQFLKLKCHFPDRPARQPAPPLPTA